MIETRLSRYLSVVSSNLKCSSEFVIRFLSTKEHQVAIDSICQVYLRSL